MKAVTVGRVIGLATITATGLTIQLSPAPARSSGGVVVIVAPRIGSAATVGAPAIVTPAAILPAVIVSSAIVRSPRVDVSGVSVALATIPTASVVSAPALLLAGVATIAAPLLNSAAVVHASSVSVGAVAVTLPAIGTTSNTWPLAVAAAPAGSLQPGSINSTAAVQAPALIVGGVVVPVSPLPSSSIPPAPSVSVGPAAIATPVIASSSSAFPPSLLAGTVAIVAQLIAGASSTSVPRVLAGEARVSPPPIGSSYAVASPAVTPGVATVAVPAPASSSTSRQPAVLAGSVGVSTPLLTPTASMLAPSVSVAQAASRTWTYADAGSTIASLHDFSTLSGANGSQITTFADASPYGRTLTGAGSTKPTVITNALAGKPVAKTAYSGQRHFTYPASYTADWTAGGAAFAILKLDADPPAPEDSGGSPFGSFGTAGSVSLYPNEFSPDTEPFGSDFGGSLDNLFGQSLKTFDLAAWHSMSQRARHGDRRLSINASELPRNTFDGNGTAPAWGAAPKLGASPWAYTNHSYAVAITFRRVPPLSVWQKVEAKAHHDRGLQALLPAGHPYKDAPPTVSTADPIAAFIAGQRIAIEGDSITWMTNADFGRDSWANRLMKYYPTLQMQNFAVASATIAGNNGNSLEGRMSAVLAYAGKAIMIFIGANDLGNTSTYPTVNDWFSALKVRIAQYRAGGYERVAVATQIPQTGSSWAARASAANTLIRNDAAIDVVIDFAADPVIGAANAAANTALFNDGLHPTGYGQSILADVAEPALLKLLGLTAKGSASVASGAKLAFPVRIHGLRSTFALSGTDAASFELVNGPEGAVPWDAKTLRYAGDASAVAGTKNVTITATDEFNRSSVYALTVVAA